MKKSKKVLLFLLIVLTLGLCVPVQAKAAVKINKKTVTLIKGQTTTLKITGTKSKIAWSSNKKTVAIVSSKGKVTAKKKGTATITAKVGKKKYTCKVTVETPSLNSTSLALIAGDTSILKMSGTSQTVKWSSSKTSVATVSNGKITAKAAGSATIMAKVGSKTYKCKVTVAAAFSNSKAKEKIQKKVVAVNGSVFVLLTSKYDWATDVSAKCTFYNASGNPVDYTNDSVSYLEYGHKAVLEFGIPSVEFSTYKITYEYTEGLKYFYHKSVIDKLSLSTNLVESTYSDYLMLTIKNSNSYDCYYGKAAIIYYGSNNKIVDIDTVSFGSIAAKSSDTRKAYVPYDSETYKDIEYSRYEAFISYAYHLGK